MAQQNINNENNISSRAMPILFLLGIFFGFFNSFYSFFIRWYEPNSYYTHGPFIIIAAAWLFKKRIDINPPETKHTSNTIGIGIVFFSVVINVFGMLYQIYFLQCSAFYIFIFGSVLYFFSWQVIFKNIDIFLFLLVALPLPGIYILSITFGLKLFATDVAGTILSWIYPAMEISGNLLKIKGHVIEVTPACSGLQNILGMFSLLWFLALLQTKKIIAVIDFLIAVPAALLSNVLRIVIVCVLVVNGYGKFALVDWHEEIGMGIFLLVFLATITFNDLSLNRFKTDRTYSITKLLNSRKRYIITSSVLLIAVAVTGYSWRYIDYQSKSSEPYIFAKNLVPKKIEEWTSVDADLNDSIFNVLGTKDVLMRTFERKTPLRKDEKENVYLLIVRSRDMRKVGHPPEVCIEGEGYNLINNEQQEILRQDLKIPITRLIFKKGERGLLVYYWYRFNGKNINSFIEHQIKYVLRRSKTGITSMIRFSAIVNPDDVKDIVKKEKMVVKFIKDSYDVIIDKL